MDKDKIERRVMENYEGWEPHPTRRNIYEHKDSGQLYRRMKSGWFKKTPLKVTMEFDPKQLDLLAQNVVSTLGDRLDGLSNNQAMILENQLNDSMVAYHGHAEFISSDEIEGAYEIATIYAVLPRQVFIGR